MKKQTLSTIKFTAKILLAAFLFWFLARKGLVSVEATKRALERYEYIVPGFIAMVLSSLLGVIRWQLLLKAQNFKLSWLRTLQLTYIGNFFNLALPGAVSGDFVKAFYVAREADARKGHTFGTILFDRLAGVSALVVVAATAMAGILLLEESVMSSRLMNAVKLLLLSGAGGVIAFFGYLLLVRENWDPLLNSLRWAQKKVPPLASAMRIYEGVRHYHHHRWTVMVTMLISIIIHCLVSFACLQFMGALGVREAFPWAVFVVVPLGLLVTAVPLTPAGIGTGHWAFGSLFLLLGVNRGADVFNLYLLAQLLIGAVGGLIYLRFKSREPKMSEEVHEALAEL